MYTIRVITRLAYNARRTDRASASSRLRHDYALATISCEHCRSFCNNPYYAPRHIIYYWKNIKGAGIYVTSVYLRVFMQFKWTRHCQCHNTHHFATLNCSMKTRLCAGGTWINLITFLQIFIGSLYNYPCTFVALVGPKYCQRRPRRRSTLMSVSTQSATRAHVTL